MLGISYGEHKTNEYVWEQVTILAGCRQLLLSTIASYHGLAICAGVIRCWKFFSQGTLDGGHCRRLHKSVMNNIKQWTGHSMLLQFHSTNDRSRWASLSITAGASVGVHPMTPGRHENSVVSLNVCHHGNNVSLKISPMVTVAFPNLHPVCLQVASSFACPVLNNRQAGCITTRHCILVWKSCCFACFLLQFHFTMSYYSSSKSLTKMVSTEHGNRVLAQLCFLQRNDMLCDFTVSAEGMSLQVSFMVSL